MRLKKGIELYNKDKNYYLSIIDIDDNEDIIASGSLNLKTGINFYKDINIEGSLSIQSELEIGKRKTRVTNNGKLLTSQLSNENFKDGTIVGFNNSLCQPVSPREHMYIKSSEQSSVKYNDMIFRADEFPPEDTEITYTFTLPSFFINNILDIQFYFINPSEHSLDTAEFSYNIVIPELNIKTDSNKITSRKKGFFSTSNFRNTIVNADDIDVSNSFVCLNLKRNKGYGSSDSVQNSVYFIGMKIEYHINYYKGTKYND